MRRFIVTVSLLLLAIACIGMAGTMHGRLLEMREEYGLSKADPLVDTPPMVAFSTVALGGFRGLIVDMLWLRASRLKEEGKYFELVQLANWITQLEPRFTSVWAFHSWNLAYNISVLFQDPADRWRWVKSGIELLRDKGILYNPGDAALYRELGWLFQHKMGATYDQAHWYYKRSWAAEMAQLFDGPRPDYAALAQAAANRRELLTREGVAELVAGIEATGVDPFSYAVVDAEALPERTRSVLAERADAARELTLYLRALRMKRIYKLLPEVMQEVDEQYGPLDWRLPEAHAIYWAYRGRAHAEGFDAVASDRMIFQSMAAAFRSGRLFTSDDGSVFIPSPNLDLLPHVRKAYSGAATSHPDQETIRNAHANFLREAMLFLYVYNRTDEAREIFDDLNKRYPSEETAAGFDAYLYSLLTAQLGDLTVRNVNAVIEGALFQGYFWLGLGDEDRARGYDQLAQLAWKRYMAARADSPELLERTGLPPLPEMRRTALEKVRETLTNQTYRVRLE